MNRFGISEAKLNQLISTIKSNPKVEGILLYGSRAKGTYKPFSDIDLTLTGTSLTRADLIDIINRVDDLLLPYEIDLSLYKDLDYPPLLEEIRLHSIPLA